MTSLKKWIEMKIKDGDINYFEYNDFRNIEKMIRGCIQSRLEQWWN